MRPYIIWAGVVQNVLSRPPPPLFPPFCCRTGVSMTTLEEVFLRIAEREHRVEDGDESDEGGADDVEAPRHNTLPRSVVSSEHSVNNRLTNQS